MRRFARCAALLLAAAAIPATATSSQAATKTYHQLSGPRLADVVFKAPYTPAGVVTDIPDWGRVGGSYACMKLKGAIVAYTIAQQGRQGMGLTIFQLNNHAAAVTAFKSLDVRGCHYKIVKPAGAPVGAVELLIPLSGGVTSHEALMVVGNAVVMVSAGDFGSHTYAVLNHALVAGVAAYRKAAYY